MRYQKITDYTRLNQLLCLAQDGDQGAFNEIYEMTAPIQYHYIRQIIPDGHRAQDALQETYLLFYQNLNKINPPSAMNAYLNRLSYYVSKNLAKYQARSDYRTLPIDYADYSTEKPQEPLAMIEDTEERRILREAIASLPPRERSLIYLRYYQRLSMKEIAASMEISSATAQRLFKSAKNNLKAILEKEGFAAALGFGHRICKAFQDTTASNALPPLPEKLAADHALPADVPTPHNAGTAAGGLMGSTVFKSLLVISCLSCAVGVGIKAAPPPDITQIETPKKPCAKSARLRIHVESTLRIRSVEVRAQGAPAISAVSNEPGIYEADVKANGIYTVVVTPSGGRKASKRVTVSCIDTDNPHCSFVKCEGQKLWVCFSDTGTGIDPDSLVARDEDGFLAKPVSYNESTGLALFEISKENQTLVYSDRAGNTAEVPLTFQNLE